MPRLLITNAQIFDGSGSGLFPGHVLIEGGRIRAVAPRAERLDADDARVIDAAGATLMPGMIEAHAHLGFVSTVDRINRERVLSPEKRLLLTVHAGQVMLDHGFTSLYSGGSVNAQGEVALRDAFEEGWLTGPRLKACSFERTATAHVQEGKRYPGTNGRPSDPAGMRDFVREMAELGVDSVKLVVTGESGVDPGTSRDLQFYEDEIQAAGRAGQEFDVWLNAHVHSAESVKMAVRHGFRVLYHCTWTDEEGMDMIEARKDEVFVAPGPGINWANCYEGGEYVTREMAEEQEQFITLEQVQKVMPQLRKRGVRVLPGGDYGFPWNPMGKNARDLELFVKLFGFTPAEALRAATHYGGQLMGMGDELGLIRPGYLADLLLVDGDPLSDIGILQDRDRLMMILKGGRVHKAKFQGAAPRMRELA